MGNLTYSATGNLTAAEIPPIRWSPIEDHRALLPKYYVPAFFITLVVSLALPHGKNRIWFTLPFVLGLVAMLPYHTEGSFKKDFDLGNLVLGWFLVYLSLILTTPEAQYWKMDGVSAISTEERLKQMEAKSVWQKLPWSFGVWTNPRGIGWSHQVANLRPATTPGTSLWNFVLQKLFNAAVLLLIVDALHLWYKSLERSGPNWTVWSLPIPLQILLGGSNQFRIYCEMASMHSLAAAGTTALGIYKPADWPPITGHLRNAYTVKRFWGMVWHQFMRQVAHPGGLLLSRDILRLRKGSFAARGTYLVAAFASTGFYHTIVNIYASGGRGLNPCGDMEFFVSQGVIVFLESLLIDLVVGSGHASSKRWKILGYIWCFCCVSYSQLWYVENLRQAGLWDVDIKYLKYVPGVVI